MHPSPKPGNISFLVRLKMIDTLKNQWLFQILWWNSLSWQSHPIKKQTNLSQSTETWWIRAHTIPGSILYIYMNSWCLCFFMQVNAPVPWILWASGWLSPKFCEVTCRSCRDGRHVDQDPFAISPSSRRHCRYWPSDLLEWQGCAARWAPDLIGA